MEGSVAADIPRGASGEELPQANTREGVVPSSPASPVQIREGEWVASRTDGRRRRVMQHQTPEHAFHSGPLNLPTKTVYVVQAVWQWQMSEWLWVPFDLSVTELLESLWDMQKIGEGTPHKVFIFVPPWTYVVDIKRMIQQNVSTRGVRPIRRCASGAYLWYIQKSGEKCIR